MSGSDPTGFDLSPDEATSPGAPLGPCVGSGKEWVGMEVLFVGDDWSEDHHDVCLMDPQGQVLAARRLPEGVEGLQGPCPVGGMSGCGVVIGIETDQGMWVQALIASRVPGVRDQSRSGRGTGTGPIGGSEHHRTGRMSGSGATPNRSARSAASNALHPDAGRAGRQRSMTGSETGVRERTLLQPLGSISGPRSRSWPRCPRSQNWPPNWAAFTHPDAAAPGSASTTIRAGRRNGLSGSDTHRGSIHPDAPHTLRAANKLVSCLHACLNQPSTQTIPQNQPPPNHRT